MLDRINIKTDRIKHRKMWKDDKKREKKQLTSKVDKQCKNFMWPKYYEVPNLPSHKIIKPTCIYLTTIGLNKHRNHPIQFNLKCRFESYLSALPEEKEQGNDQGWVFPDTPLPAVPQEHLENQEHRARSGAHPNQMALPGSVPRMSKWFCNKIKSDMNNCTVFLFSTNKRKPGHIRSYLRLPFIAYKIIKR